MIHRKFDKLKFRRTYIGGSKQKELNKFIEVQGTKEDNSECNWFEYRGMLKQYMDDKLNILLSWTYIMNMSSIILAIIAMFVLITNIPTAIVIVSISLILFFVSKYLNHVEKRMLSHYDFSLDIINQETGVSLSKN
jgi:hypothetical protein